MGHNPQRPSVVALGNTCRVAFTDLDRELQPKLFLLLIDQGLQVLARFEIRDALGRDINSNAGLGVAANPALSLADSKAAKTTDLNLVSCDQRPRNTVENSLQDDLRVPARHLDNS